MASKREHPCIKCRMVDVEANLQAFERAADVGFESVWVHAKCLEQYRRIDSELAFLEFLALFEERARSGGGV